MLDSTKILKEYFRISRDFCAVWGKIHAQMCRKGESRLLCGGASSNTGVSCNIRVDFWSSTNITQNTSTVTMNAYLDYTAPIYSSAQKSVTFNCNGGSYTQNFTIPSGGSGHRSLSLGSWSNTVAHNSDGTKTCYIGISAKINITYSGRYIGEISAGGDVRLDNIPRTATIETATDFGIENEHSITYRASDGSFFYNLWVEAYKSGTPNVHHMEFLDYSSGQKIKFADSDIAAIYEIDMPDTKPGAYVDIIYHLETWMGPGKTNYIGADVRTVKGYIRGNSYTKVGNSWRRCVPFIKVQKNWKPCVCYQNVNRTWKPTHL